MLTVLVFAGNDPSGGAGLCADIQALSHANCHTAPVITSATVQNSRQVFEITPFSGKYVQAQAQAVLSDIPIAAFKIGLLGSVEIIESIAEILKNYPSIPVIFDPILAAGSGRTFSNKDIKKAMIRLLLPLTYILTPNSEEAKNLTDLNHLEESALQLMDEGCQYVCITGTHENTEKVTHHLYGQGNFLKSWQWQRLPYNYHGSGCTFASHLAGQIAQGNDIIEAVYTAQSYTWQSLNHGFYLGHGQAFPNRLYSYNLLKY
jgi:hydroxymethylpyrimidine/phosphomethylpyrimidine kinase